MQGDKGSVQAGDVGPAVGGGEGRSPDAGRTYVGIDNGVTGSIGIVTGWGKYALLDTPTKKELSYTKAKKFISRVDHEALVRILTGLGVSTMVVMERPMVNPGRFFASMSAMRALESTLIAVEKARLAFRYIDSREWQKALLPSGLEKEELKVASRDIGLRLFPLEEEKIRDRDEADSLLIAEYARRKQL